MQIESDTFSEKKNIQLWDMAYPPVPEALGDQAQGESSRSGLDDSDSDEAAAISCDQLRRSETT